MWVWLDRVGLVLFDAALSTGLFLSVVVLALFVCRQPSRRLLIVRVVAAGVSGDDSAGRCVPLPRLDLLDMIPPGGFLPPAFAVESSGRNRSVADCNDLAAAQGPYSRSSRSSGRLRSLGGALAAPDS